MFIKQQRKKTTLEVARKIRFVGGQDDCMVKLVIEISQADSTYCEIM